MIRVVIADDHHLVRQGIRALLEKAPDVQVIGEAADGLETIELTRVLKPDVLLLDLGMPRLNGIQVIQRLAGLELPTRVVILSMHSDDTLVHQALRNGAAGYLLKRSLSDELLLALRAASQGKAYVSPAVSHVLLDPLRGHDTAASGFDSLTPREREVLRLIAHGHTNVAMARQLQISVKTVEKHRAAVMSKLGVHDVANLTRLAIKHGLVFLEE